MKTIDEMKLEEVPVVFNHPMRLKAVTKNGRVLEAEHLIMAEQYQGQWVFMAMLRPLNNS